MYKTVDAFMDGLAQSVLVAPLFIVAELLSIFTCNCYKINTKNERQEHLERNNGTYYTGLRNPPNTPYVS